MMQPDVRARNQKNSGFTLIELLVVIGIITILTAAVILAVNPARQFQSSRDTTRRAHLDAITLAIYTYATENDGIVPTDITTTPTHLGIGGGLIDLSDELVPVYIASMPVDPLNGNLAGDSQYTIYRDVNGRVVATAASELNPGTPIQVVR